MNKEMLWVWLTTLPYMTSKKINSLFDRFEGIEDIYSADKYRYIGIDSIRSRDVENLCNKSLDRAKKVIEETKKAGGYILCFDDAEYPSQLRYCDEPPYVLYIRGEHLMWDRLFCISVIGTRSCTDYGIQATNSICYDLAANGVTIVSGMAKGLDAAAHNAALKAGSKTIAILGNGIERAYPHENAELMEEIVKNGAVISEYPPHSLPDRIHFPKRNRLIAAFSRGVLITESPARGGSLITARWALDMGKDVFAVPGPYSSHTSRGCNDLIKNSAAMLTESAVDILSCYPDELKMMGKSTDDIVISKKKTVTETPAEVEKKADINSHIYSGLSEDERKIISVLCEKNAHIDEICNRTGINAADVGAALTMLELSGYVTQLPGKIFALQIQ